MKLVRVEEIPAIRTNDECNTHDLVRLFEDFLASDMKYAEVVLAPGEYSCVECARMSLHQTCKIQQYPVYVRFRAGKLYLGKKEI